FVINANNRRVKISLHSHVKMDGVAVQVKGFSWWAPVRRKVHPGITPSPCDFTPPPGIPAARQRVRFVYDGRMRQHGFGLPGFRRSAPTFNRAAKENSWAAPFPKNQRKTPDRKSTRLNSSHVKISYAVFCLKKKK